MAETSIEWCRYTFNPVRGCQKVSAGCKICYAERQSKRNPKVLGEWGPKGRRAVAAESYWREPYKWNREAERGGTQQTVFCASLADVGEDRPEWVEPRSRLQTVIRETPWLVWLLLTKRPENIPRLFPDFMTDPPQNVMWGTSIEDQPNADLRIPYLMELPGPLFLSCEPLLGPIDLVGWGELSASVDVESFPKCWDDYVWPKWVPQKERDMVVKFYSWGMRHPKTYAQAMEGVGYNPPANGSWVGVRYIGKNLITGLVTKPDDPRAAKHGRFLFRWNNMGSVITDEGESLCVSFGPGVSWLQNWLCPDGEYRQRIRWVIVGGESGPGARPMYPDWVRSLRDQCLAWETPFLFKQWGDYMPESQGCPGALSSKTAKTALYVDPDGSTRPARYGARKDGYTVQRVGKKKAGRLLDGRTWHQFPEWPGVSS